MDFKKVAAFIRQHLVSALCVEMCIRDRPSTSSTTIL